MKPPVGESGPVFNYRGATIYSNAKLTNYTFALGGFPHGPRGLLGGIGHIDAIVALVDSWLDTGTLPAPYLKKG